MPDSTSASRARERSHSALRASFCLASSACFFSPSKRSLRRFLNSRSRSSRDGVLPGAVDGVDFIDSGGRIFSLTAFSPGGGWSPKCTFPALSTHLYTSADAEPANVAAASISNIPDLPLRMDNSSLLDDPSIAKILLQSLTLLGFACAGIIFICRKES